VTSPPALELRGVSLSFAAGRGERLVVLDGLDLAVGAGEVVSLIGPNGSGKSTLLRVAAGLLRPDAGGVFLGERALVGPDPGVGLVFQEHRLLPWRSVARNVAYPMELAGWPAARRGARVDELLGLVGLRASADVVPSRLSGGMRQRAALARGLALSPQVLLLDEPFSALDALTRERFNLELLKLWAKTGASILFVTHSVQEAIFMGDRVVVLSPRPGHVIADLPVPFGRPRRPEVLDELAAGLLAGRIRGLLKGGDVRPPGDEAGRPGGEPDAFDPTPGEIGAVE
jgi:ABC-type nitrate/sulfonate/bicarbonate transport system ATPase subunit